MSLWTSEPASVPKAHCEKRFARTLREGFRFALFVLWLEPLRAPTRYRRTFPPPAGGSGGYRPRRPRGR